MSRRERVGERDGKMAGTVCVWQNKSKTDKKEIKNKVGKRVGEKTIKGREKEMKGKENKKEVYNSSLW